MTPTYFLVDFKKFDDLTAFKIIKKEPVSDDEVIITVYGFGKTESAGFRLQRFGSNWKFASPVKDNPAIASK